MGTPEFAVPALSALMESAEHEVLFVITQPDRPKGRGMHVSSPPVKVLSERAGLAVYQPETLKNNEQIRGLLDDARPDAVIVVAYGRMIPEQWFTIPRFGFINAHASLLPEFRGASPINRAILAGHATTGISIMQIDAAMDAGPVYAQAALSIGEDEDAVGLAERLSALGAQTLLEALPLIGRGSLRPVPQDHGKATYAPMLRKEDGRIDWAEDVRTIHNMIRGLVPWPCAYTSFQGRTLRILKASYEIRDTGHAPGTLIRERAGVRIACADGFINALHVQVEGKNAMDGRAFSNGMKTDQALLGR